MDNPKGPPDNADDIAPALPDDYEAEPDFEDSLVEELATLIDGGRTYAEAELAFQRTRAKLTGRLIGVSLALVVVALILLHIAFLALAVGLVIALEPMLTIWGAVGLVFGGLLLLVALLGWMALKRAQKLGRLFSAPDDGGGA